MPLSSCEASHLICLCHQRAPTACAAAGPISDPSYYCCTYCTTRLENYLCVGFVEKSDSYLHQLASPSPAGAIFYLPPSPLGSHWKFFKILTPHTQPLTFQSARGANLMAGRSLSGIEGALSACAIRWRCHLRCHL